MKKLILDYATWRCGKKGEHALGEGDTALLNPEGYMCCLGQFSFQLKPELTKENVMNRATPAALESYGLVEGLEPFVQYIHFLDSEDGYASSTDLTIKAININDNPDTTPLEKIEALKELFSERGYEIEVVNLPDGKENTELVHS